MSNFFTDNPDLMFALDNVDLADVVALREENYKQAEDYDFAPENYEDAKDSYKRVLEVIGEVTGERIAPCTPGRRRRSHLRKRKSHLSPAHRSEH